MVFIQKPGKATYDQAKAFRPMSLTSFLRKTLENWAIRVYELPMYMLHVLQYAYQSEKSCELAIKPIVDKAEKAKKSKKLP